MAKSVLLSYILFFTFGLFGGHLIYLERYEQSFLYLSSCNLFFLSLFYDFFRIPHYVRVYNSKQKQKSSKHPPRVRVRVVIAQIIYSVFYSYVFYYIIPPCKHIKNFIAKIDPEEMPSLLDSIEFCSFIDFLRFLMSKLGIILAIKLVASIVNLNGPTWKILGFLGTIEIFLPNKYIYLLFIFAIGYFQYYRKPSNNSNSIINNKNKELNNVKVIRLRYSSITLIKQKIRDYISIIKLIVAILLFWGCLISALILHPSITLNLKDDPDAEPVTYYFHEVITDVLMSKTAKNIKEFLFYWINRVFEVGWDVALNEFSEIINNKLEVNDADMALSDLDLPKNATQAEIRKRYKEMVVKWHPDKSVRGVSKEDQKDKFIEIQKAYEILTPRHIKKKLKEWIPNKRKKNNDTNLDKENIML